jgi:hypothetical protein
LTAAQWIVLKITGVTGPVVQVAATLEFTSP